MTNRDDEPFADKLNSIPKVVFSRTLDRAPWGTWNEARVVKDDAIEEVAELKRQPGKNMIVWGSISLVQSFLDAGLIDEYRLVVCPVVLGHGRPLFIDRSTSLDLKLLQVKKMDLGAALLTYSQR